MAAPTITTVHNDGRGIREYGLNISRHTATSAAADNWANDILVDLSSIASGLKIPTALKVNRISGVCKTAAKLTFEFRHIGTDRLIGIHQGISTTAVHSHFDLHCINLKDTTSELLLGCEVAWDAQVNVTTAQEATIIAEGTYSASIAPAAAFTTGLLATKAITSIDITGYHGLGFYIRSSVALQPNDLSILIDETATCASPEETMPIPIALAANKWYWIQTNFTNATLATRDAIISVGLQANRDFGAATIYIDGIRVQKRKDYEMSNIGDLVVTSAGIANLDDFYFVTEWELCYAEDKIIK